MIGKTTGRRGFLGRLAALIAAPVAAKAVAEESWPSFMARVPSISADAALPSIAGLSRSSYHDLQAFPNQLAFISRPFDPAYIEDDFPDEEDARG